MDSFDVLLVDLQDLGCRVYTSSRRCATFSKRLPSGARRSACWTGPTRRPPGRGAAAARGWESFVGAGSLPMRHGLTPGEAAKWFVQTLGLEVDCNIIEMQGWEPACAPGYGWPLGARAWVNPSPNASNPWMARCYAGTVMLEGTALSEGRGTTRPLELFGAPDLQRGFSWKK